MGIQEFIPTRKIEAAPGTILVLTELVGTGCDRVCWRHPLDRSLCIKVARPDQVRAQNDIDFHYGRHLANRSVVGPHLTRMHGWVETDHGPGLVFDLVQEPDGTSSPALVQALRAGLITRSEATALIDEAFGWLATHRVILADAGISNFLVQRSADGVRRLVFVDGLGARHFGIRYWARRTFGFLARRKAAQFHHLTLEVLGKRLGPSCSTEKSSHLRT